MDTLMKVIIIGDSTVGKTSFVHRYVQNAFEWNYKPTLGVDFSLKEVKIKDDTTIRVQLWDIAGQDNFSSMTRVYYKDSHACVIMFDITHRQTFHNVFKWKEDLDNKYVRPNGDRVPCVLLANKSDLTYPAVDEQEIKNLCSDLGFLGYFIISVKTGDTVDDAMRYLLERTYEDPRLESLSMVHEANTSNDTVVTLAAESKCSKCCDKISKCIPCVTQHVAF